jgi:hypothetical protein
MMRSKIDPARALPYFEKWHERQVKTVWWLDAKEGSTSSLYILRNRRMHESPYHLVVICGRRLVSVLEQSSSQDERTFSIRVDGVMRGSFNLLDSYAPGLSIVPPRVIVWGGRKFFALNLEGQDFGEFASEDELHAVYDLGGLLCLVGETSVALFDLDARNQVARYEHHEVILAHFWGGDSLVIEDFQGNRLSVEVTPQTTELRPASVSH